MKTLKLIACTAVFLLALTNCTKEEVLDEVVTSVGDERGANGTAPGENHP